MNICGGDAEDKISRSQADVRSATITHHHVTKREQGKVCRLRHSSVHSLKTQVHTFSAIFRQ